MSNNPGPDHGIDHGSYPGQSVSGWGNPGMQGSGDAPDTGKAPAISYSGASNVGLDGKKLNDSIGHHISYSAAERRRFKSEMYPQDSLNEAEVSEKELNHAAAAFSYSDASGVWLDGEIPYDEVYESRHDDDLASVKLDYALPNDSFEARRRTGDTVNVHRSQMQFYTDICSETFDPMEFEVKSDDRMQTVKPSDRVTTHHSGYPSSGEVVLATPRQPRTQSLVDPEAPTKCFGSSGRQVTVVRGNSGQPEVLVTGDDPHWSWQSIEQLDEAVSELIRGKSSQVSSSNTSLSATNLEVERISSEVVPHTRSADQSTVSMQVSSSEVSAPRAPTLPAISLVEPCVQLQQQNRPICFSAPPLRPGDTWRQRMDSLPIADSAGVVYQQCRTQDRVNSDVRGFQPVMAEVVVNTHQDGCGTVQLAEDRFNDTLVGDNREVGALPARRSYEAVSHLNRVPYTADVVEQIPTTNLQVRRTSTSGPPAPVQPPAAVSHQHCGGRETTAAAEVDAETSGQPGGCPLPVSWSVGTASRSGQTQPPWTQTRPR